MVDDRESFRKIVAALGRTYRTFRLIPKDRSPFMKFLYYAALMFLWCPTFLTDYTTVILARVYMPPDLIDTRAGYRVLPHERVHIRDCFRWGILPFMISYLFLLPTVLTLRALWEMRAYTETMRVDLELDGEITDETLDHIQRQFTSSAYFWMFPFSKFIRRKLEAARTRLEREIVG